MYAAVWRLTCGSLAISLTLATHKQYLKTSFFSKNIKTYLSERTSRQTFQIPSFSKLRINPSSGFWKRLSPGGFLCHEKINGRFDCRTDYLHLEKNSKSKYTLFWLSFSEWAYYEFLLTIYSNILQGSSVAKEENSIIVAKGITYSVPNSLPLSFIKISAKKFYVQDTRRKHLQSQRMCVARCAQCCKDWIYNCKV